MPNRIISTLSRLPRGILGVIIAAVAVVETCSLLLTIVLIKDLTASGADARDERLENGLDWSLGVFMTAITVVFGLVLLAFILAYRRRKAEAT